MREDDRRIRLLIVDDEPGIASLLEQKLQQAGYICRSCTSGKHALELLAQEAFGAVISDLQMPEISGLDLLKEVQKKHPDCAFLMATGLDDARVGVQAMKQGAADYLLKPLDLEAVVASLDRALKMKRMALEVEHYRKYLEQIVDQRTKQLQDAIWRIEQTYDETLKSLAGALDLRDNETAGHSARVARYCTEIAKAAGCSGDQLKHIVRGAQLHDIGKIGIPDSILRKPGKLTPEEWEVMKTHARVGYELVRGIAFLAPAAEIVLTHQERYDGSGYPQGLRAEEIPLGSRIFAVADTLDAMTSDRPYRKALTFSEARDEITRESGRQFDPGVVRIFRSFPETTWEDIREQAADLRPDELGVLASQAIRDRVA